LVGMEAHCEDSRLREAHISSTLKRINKRLENDPF
jgi:hypothetical protein